MSLDAKPRVVYLMGAGASAQALPMVSQIPKALEDHYNWLWEFAKEAKVRKEMIPGKPETERSKLLGEYLKIITDLKEGSASHESIDTYAKKLFLRSKSVASDRQKFIELKIGLALFMAYLQAKHKTPDKRYDGFLASLLDHTPGSTLTLPPEVLVLSWNYDQQLALSHAAYQHDGSMWGGIEQLGMRPLEMLPVKSRYPCRSIHLNGMFAYRADFDEIHPLVQWTTNNEEDLLDSMMHFFANLQYNRQMHPGRLLLRFAWEKNDQTIAAFGLLEEVLSECEALVVIGYSFPFFNREIDREVVKRMQSLKRVYVQAPQKAAEEIARTVRTLNLPEGCQVETYANTDKFLLPPEL